MWAKFAAAVASTASVFLLIGCAGTAPRDMPSSRSVVADVLPQVADVKVLRGQLAEARAQGYEDSWAIKPQFFTANSFHQGLAAVGVLVPKR